MHWSNAQRAAASKPRRRSWAAMAIGVLLTIGSVLGWAVWPLLAMANLHHAARIGDVEALQRGVDWPAVRESITASAIEHIALATATAPDDERAGSGGAAEFGRVLGRIVGPALAKRAVARFASPEGVVAAFEDRRRLRRLAGTPEQNRDWLERVRETWSRLDSFRFASPSTVEVVARIDKHRSQRVRAKLELRGWRWIVTAVHLPAS